MLFNSIAFLVFFSVFFFLFYFLPANGRKLLLFAASCLFYMWFIPAYILILFVTILIDYVAAIKIEDSSTQKKKKRILLIGIVNTCLVLFIFKYHNFFVDNLNAIGFRQLQHWQLILPIGLSFHTFQSLSYIIEVYRGNIKAERNLLNYSNFVMMFPQLVAGPIERASNLLPQLKTCDHTITYKDFAVGFHRFFWGLFKKAVVADTLSKFVDVSYNNYSFQPGAMLLLGTILFAIQIYCDFSGYSDMAIGVARMLGFKFKENFLLPYFSKSITEFWKRWHISLSSWLKDYLYISLGGNRSVKWKTYRNLMLTMLLGGLWHGASWNFIIWGALNGLYLSIEKITDFYKFNSNNFLLKCTRSLYVFILISFSWIFFRSATIEQATTIIKKICCNFDVAKFKFWDLNIFPSIIFALLVLLGFEYFVLRKKTFDQLFDQSKGYLKLAAYSFIFIFLILLFGNSNGSQFIYFQF